jgi:hypothetical protein
MIERLPGIGKIVAVFDRGWLVGLLSADLLLIALHIYSAATLPEMPRPLTLWKDRSIGEFFGYFEVGLAAALLLLASVRMREPIMLACSAMFACVMLDDITGIHEIGGSFFSTSLQFQGTEWLKGNEIGELLVWAILTGLFLPLLAYGFLRTPRNRWYRAFGLILLTALLAAFAVIVDMSHGAVCQFQGGFSYCGQVMFLAEDGGEKVTQSLILAHVIFLVRDASAPALFDLTQGLLPARIGALLR